jgi:hypothetical protein
MSDYSNTYGGAAKDSAQDIILGADIDSQLDAIETSTISKANKIVSADTDNILLMDSTGDLKDSTYNIAELTDLILGSVYPVGSILHTTTATNPATSLGFTSTWTRIAEGRTLIGEGTGSGLTARTAAAEVGQEDAVVVAHQHDAVADHGHPFRITPTTESSASINTTGGFPLKSSGTNYAAFTGTPTITAGQQIGGGGAHQHASEGVSGTDKNMQPSLVVYIWERTA